jgi:GNAT superfamily N-acetyltransferase
MSLRLRIATHADMAEMKRLMAMAIGQLMGDFLSPEQVEGSHETMGIDTQLIDDGTYFVVEEEGVIVGCGGWSRRATLYGGDHSAGRDNSLLDPAEDPARIRAMYTHPEHVRRGIGQMIIDAGEAAARAEGFKSAQMGATLAGEPLYRRCGYEVIEVIEKHAKNGAIIPLKIMGKAL